MLVSPLYYKPSVNANRWELRKDAPAAGLSRRRIVRETAAAIGMSALPVALWVGILFCVSVSASAFNGLHCRRFLDDSDT